MGMGVAIKGVTGLGGRDRAGEDVNGGVGGGG